MHRALRADRPLQHRLLVVTEGAGWEKIRAWCPCYGELQSGPMSPTRWREVLTLADRHPGPSPDPLPRRS